MKKNTVSIEVSLNTLLLTTAFIVGGFVLWKIRAVVFMFFLAFIIASALRPTIDYLEKKKIPRFVSVATIFTFLIIIISFVMSTVIVQTVEQFTNLVSEFPSILSNLGGILSNIVEKLVSFVNKFPGTDGVVSEDRVEQEILKFFGDTGATDLTGFLGDGFNGAITVINSAIVMIFGTFTVLIISFYMLIRKETIYSGTLNLLPIKKKEKYTQLLKQIETKLGHWLRGQLILMFAVGFMTWFGMIVPSFFFEGYNLHEFALLLGFVAALLSAIPNLGPIIAGFVGVIIAAGSNPISPLLPVLYITILFTVIQQIEGILLVPNIMKRAVGLDPVITIIAVIAALIVFNIIGAIIIVPALAVIQIIFRHQIQENRERQEQEEKRRKSKRKTKSIFERLPFFLHR